jgi:hypothetical protein
MYSFTHSFSSALDGGELSASRSAALPPKERAPRTHLIRGWVGPRAGLDAVVKRKIPNLAGTRSCILLLLGRHDSLNKKYGAENC